MFLEHGQTKFKDNIEYEIGGIPKGLFIKKIFETKVVDGVEKKFALYEFSKANDEGETLKELTEEVFKEYFGKHIRGRNYQESSRSIVLETIR